MQKYVTDDLWELNFQLRPCVDGSYRIHDIVTLCNTSSHGRSRVWMRPILADHRMVLIVDQVYTYNHSLLNSSLNTQFYMMPFGIQDLRMYIKGSY
jgi:hypothetical protein